MSKMHASLTVLSLFLLSLGGCKTLDKIDAAGELTPMTHIQNPQAKPDYQPVTMPMPNPKPPYGSPNSLWRTGAQGFFKDQRASQVGDILTVVVNFTDTVNFSNATDTNRNSQTNTGVSNLLGFENKAKSLFPHAFDNTKLFNMQSNPTHNGTGSIKRTDQMVTNVAASIVQLLPNGNFVISGRQEVRVNNELRELLIEGIVRPEDITAANSIDLTKIAEARISYGGRGVLTNIQEAPVGQQIIEAISPF
ncbi:MAG: flagellar basal body L-ring protein FlgH [Candidatus Nucleicultricaceae bacterium]